MNQGGADGISFAFHQGNSDDIGFAGGNLGIGGLQNVLGFKLDTHHNTARSPQSDLPGSQVDIADSDGFGWGADSSTANQYGSFIVTKKQMIEAASGKFVERWWSIDDAASAQELPTSALDGKFHNFIIDFDSQSRMVTINYDTSQGMMTWQAVIDPSLTLFSLVINGSTCGNKNLQQFKLHSFEFQEAASVNVEYIDTEGNTIANAIPSYPSGPFVNGTYQTEKLDIEHYQFLTMDNDGIYNKGQIKSLAPQGELTKKGDNGTIIYVYQKLGSAVLTKTDETSEESLEGAVFDLQKSDGSKVRSDLITNDHGQITINDLVPGEYQLVETKAPTGYELDETPVTFTVEKGQTSAVELTKTNKLTPGGVVLEKVDEESGESLEGAVFKLLDQAGKEKQSGLRTDASGKLAIEGLAPGEYQLVETKAPTGYELDETPVTFTVEKGQTSAVELTKTNKLLVTDNKAESNSPKDKTKKQSSTLNKETNNSSIYKLGIFPKTGESSGSVFIILMGVLIIGIVGYVIKKKVK